MHPRKHVIRTLDDLRDYVQETLCHHDHFEVGAFPISEHVLVRAGSPCGIYFCLHGPREVKVSAIWETDNNSILFYSSSGERFHKTQLVDAPQLELTAA